MFKGCISIGSGEDICFIPLLFSHRGVFYVWDKKVVDLSIQDQFSFVPVLSSNKVQVRADAFLTRFGAGCCIC